MMFELTLLDKKGNIKKIEFYKIETMAVRGGENWKRLRSGNTYEVCKTSEDEVMLFDQEVF